MAGKVRGDRPGATPGGDIFHLAIIVPVAPFHSDDIKHIDELSTHRGQERFEIRDDDTRPL